MSCPKRATAATATSIQPVARRSFCALLKWKATSKNTDDIKIKLNSVAVDGLPMDIVYELGSSLCENNWPIPEGTPTRVAIIGMTEKSNIINANIGRIVLPVLDSPFRVL